MKIYTVNYGEIGADERRIEAFLFKRSAIKRIKRRIADGGNYREVEPNFWATSAMFISLVAVTLKFTDFSLIRWIKQRCHWQNLNEKKDGSTGSILKHGRAWIYGKWEDERANRRKELHLEWSLLTKFWALRCDVGSGDGDDGISFWIACGLFSLHISFEGILSRKFIDRMQEKAKSTKYMGYGYMALPRTTGISIHDNTIWFEIWNTDDWSSQQPKWMSFNFNVVDFLFGERKYESKVVAESVGEVILNDGNYPVKIQLTEDSWKRPRLPKPLIVRRARVESEKGIPIPGKGESSWDCGEDAVFSSTFPADSFDAALNHVRESVIKTRERHGGKNWMPEKVA